MQCLLQKYICDILTLDKKDSLTLLLKLKRANHDEKTRKNTLPMLWIWISWIYSLMRTWILDAHLRVQDY